MAVRGRVDEGCVAFVLGLVEADLPPSQEELGRPLKAMPGRIHQRSLSAPWEKTRQSSVKSGLGLNVAC